LLWNHYTQDPPRTGSQFSNSRFPVDGTHHKEAPPGDKLKLGGIFGSDTPQACVQADGVLRVGTDVGKELTARF